jgi:predicted aldo/keto reductase-like oxidoreductase
MLYKEYGKTGINLSVIGFGGMRFRDQKDVDECAELVQAAYDTGINYFDTAPGYGDSEKLFGEAFRNMKKTRTERPFYVATKTGHDNPSNVRRDLETSLERMGLEYIDFYHAWCVMSPEVYRTRKANGVLKEFERMKEEGLIRHICVSSHMAGKDIADMLADYPFEGVLLGYSAMNFAYRDAALDAAAALNRGVVTMNPLGGGAIPQHPERFEFIKRGHDISVAQGALQFIINDPRATVALVGLSTQDELQQAICAVDRFQPIPSDEIDAMRGNLSQSFDALCTSCCYCDSCPQGIPIPRFMESYNHYMLNENPLNMINRLRWHWGIGPNSDLLSRCTQCGLCEQACTQHLPIIERLATVRKEQQAFLLAEAAKG